MALPPVARNVPRVDRRCAGVGVVPSEREYSRTRFGETPGAAYHSGIGSGSGCPRSESSCPKRDIAASGSA